MKCSFVGLLVLALVAVTGCSQSTPGGPGAAAPDAKKPLYGQAEDTFDLSVPSSLPYRSTTLKQGETTPVSISIKRGKNFDQDVTLKFEGMPTGVTLDPARPDIKRGDTEVKFALNAADDAALGDFTVKVTGHPTKGGDATSEFKLTVAQKDPFTLSVPLQSTTLKQGNTQAVSIGIKRDKNFDYDVTLKFAGLPQGVILDPTSPVLKNGDTEAKLMLKGADDAPLGNFTIKVTGHPTKGSDATNEFKLIVAQK